MVETTTPDNWVVVKFDWNDGTYAKILGGWSGGYLYGNSWRINSGVVSIDDTNEEFYLVKGASGSVYKCHKNSEIIRMNIAGVVKTLEEHGAEIISMKDLIKGLDEGSIKRA